MLIKERFVQEIVNSQQEIQNKETNDLFSTLATPVLLAGGNIPLSHKQAADSYIIIKRFYKSQSLKCCILNSETALLNKYNFLPLSQMTIQDVNKEIFILQAWSFSDNAVLKKDADEIIQIRAKELRHLLSSKYTLYSTEMNNGFRALERYFEEITKYNNLPK